MLFLIGQSLGFNDRLESPAVAVMLGGLCDPPIYWPTNFSMH